jgi:uncharacterized protein YodC (DUF2158 family)
MANQFKPGDVVVLRSGGPKMTVMRVGKDSFDAPSLLCVWFEGTKREEGRFHADALKFAD